MMTNRFVKLSASVGLRFGPVRKGVTPKRILEHILQEMARLQEDHSLTTDALCLARWQGQSDAYRDVAHFIAPLTDLIPKPE